MVDRDRATGALWNAPLSSVRPMTAEELYSLIVATDPWDRVAVIEEQISQIRAEIIDCVLAEGRDCGCTERIAKRVAAMLEARK